MPEFIVENAAYVFGGVFVLFAAYLAYRRASSKKGTKSGVKNPPPKQQP